MEQIAEARNRRFKYSNNYFPYKYETLSDLEIIKYYIDNIDNNLTKEERLEIIQINENILRSLGIKYIDLKGLHPIQTDEITQSIVKAYFRYPKIIESIVCINTTKEESIRNVYAKACYDYIVEWYRIYKPSISGEELKNKIDEYVTQKVKDEIDYVENNKKTFVATCFYLGNLEEDEIPIQNSIIYRIEDNIVSHYGTNYNDVRTKYSPDKVYGETGNTLHELGHAVNNMLAIDKLNEIKNLYEDNRENMKGLLSEYAKTNISEFIAEAWAEYILSNNPRELSIKVCDIIDREYRNKFGSIHRSF